MPALPFPDPPLRDDRVALRPLRDSDRDALVEAIADPEIPRWTPIRHPYAAADAALHLHTTEAARLEGLQLSLAIVGPEDELLGSVMLIYERPGSPVAEIGYWTAAPARGRGVAARAVVLLRDWAARRLGARRVELLIHLDNTASRAVAVKAGFADTGERREPPRRCDPTGERSHAVYAWERPGEQSG